MTLSVSYHVMLYVKGQNKHITKRPKFQFINGVIIMDGFNEVVANY